MVSIARFLVRPKFRPHLRGLPLVLALGVVAVGQVRVPLPVAPTSVVSRPRWWFYISAMNDMLLVSHSRLVLSAGVVLGSDDLGDDSELLTVPPDDVTG